MNLTKNLFATFALFLTCASLAQAHAFLEHADPKVGSSDTASPATVKIWFTMAPVKATSNIRVFDAHGTEVDRQDLTVDPHNDLLLSVTVPKLPPGAYKVSWNAVCIYGHHTSGTYTFSVQPPPP